MNIKENIKTLIIEKPLKLDCGQTINNFPLAYETFGTLNENKDNAILVCHGSEDFGQVATRMIDPVQFWAS